MPKSKSVSSKDMAKETSSKEVGEMTVAFLQVLDNDEVVTKLAQILSASIQLILEEKLNHFNKKLDKIVQDSKSISDKICAVEHENAKLKHINDGLQSEITDLKLHVNNLEQESRKNCLVIADVKETFAERVADSGDQVLANSREDTTNTICSVFRDTVGVTVSPSDIQAAYRMKSKGNGPRPLLVTFYSPSVRDTVIKSRRPKQKLLFQGTAIYFNDYLTATNSALFRKAREHVKNRNASSAWVRDGKLFIKWSDTARPDRITNASDLDL